MEKIDEIASGFVTFLTQLPAAKLYAYCYGGCSLQSAALYSYLKQLNLSYSQFKNAVNELSDIDEYVFSKLEKPKKKAPVKKRVVVKDEEDEIEFF